MASNCCSLHLFSPYVWGWGNGDCCKELPDYHRHRAAAHLSSTGIVTWLHAAQEMGESVLAVHLPRPLTTTDIGLSRIFQGPESLHGFMPLRKWVSLPSLSTCPAP